MEPRCKNQPKAIQSVLSVPLPFLPSHIFHHHNLGQQTSSQSVRQSVRQLLVYAQCWISLCNSGSCTTKNKFSSYLTPLNMYGSKMLGWFLLAQFCWNAILSRQQREGSGASTLWLSGHVCDSVWKITADRESEQDIINQEISCLGHTSSYLGQNRDPFSTQPLLSHSCTCSSADPSQARNTLCTGNCSISMQRPHQLPNYCCFLSRSKNPLSLSCKTRSNSKRILLNGGKNNHIDRLETLQHDIVTSLKPYWVLSTELHTPEPSLPTTRSAN